ncbi:DUF1294 domain-containing protein [Devosia rhizoryzae]|uniref:DUF1294 domain-containing protein n=1 Tax=Devosia rhizoryzae TaxID=2774137 RepID=A0ABX7C8H1_9HYPH|nr:DUF1294 domain-containing protein [Devosia rhizoryzae]QQR38997.1 DUF1294 domain-containing protein [Devosia rhizoryzae]
MMKLSGELVQWNDERGFGFIVAEDNTRYFVHISDIGRIANRPRKGDRVSFVSARGKDGRPQARSVSIAGANPRATREVNQRGLPPKAQRLDWRFAVAFLLMTLLATALTYDRLPLAIGLAYAVMGVLSFLNYASDKRFAESGSWRTAEKRLHSVDLFFGIIGGVLGQAIFRHKTRKESFVGVTLVIVAVHLVALLGFTAGVIDPSDLNAILGL